MRPNERMTRVVMPAVLIAAGIALRLHEYLLNYSLFVDEAALTRNIIDRSWTMLLTPLDYAQVAPPGFLLAQKTIVTIFGPSEHALRLFPLLCGFASVWLCWRLSRRVLPVVPAGCALGLFSLNVAAIEYSARVKPYASDVAAGLLVLLLAATILDPSSTRRQGLWLGLAGAATALFSFTAAFLLVAAALTCLLMSRGGAPVRRETLRVASALWMGGAACGVLAGKLMISPIDSAYMRFFWSPGFMPLPPRSMEEALWLWYRFVKMFRWTGNYHAAAGWVGLMAIGVWSLVRRRRVDAALLLWLPLLLVIVAAAARQYPFTFGRVDLFLLPLLLILVAEGADWWRQLFSGRLRVLGLAPLILVLSFAGLATWRVLMKPRQPDLRLALGSVRQNWQPSDRLYVHYTAGQVFSYYAPQLGFAPDDYVRGTCSQATNRTPLLEVDGLRGYPRVWVMALGLSDNNPFLIYLNAIGTLGEARDISGSDGATSLLSEGFVSLYDLTSARRPAVSAEAFPVPEETDPEAVPWGCYGVQNPIAETAALEHR